MSHLQSEAIDHSLPPLKRAAMGLHLLVCSWCRRYGKQIRFIHCAAREHPGELQDAQAQSLSPEARERIKRSLKNGA